MNWFQVFSHCTASPGRSARWLRASLLWGLVGVILLGVGPVRASVLVTDVAFTARSDGQGYVMRVRTTDRPEAYMLRSVNEHTLKWVLYNTTLHDDYRERAPEGPVKRYTTTQQQDHLVIQVTLRSEASVSATAYRDGASSDLLLNLGYERAKAPVAENTGSGSSATPDAQPAPAGSRTEETTAQTNETTSGTGETDPIAQATRQRSRLDTVVIDPGHGGKDPGATANGLYEKNVVLDVAHKLGDYIENRLNLEVIYTRTDDRFIALEDRGHLANRAGGDLFISLHANAFRTSSVKGTETYFLGRSKTDAARRVMRKENSVVQEYEENPERYDEYDAEAFVKGELFLSSNMQFSEKFAALVQEQFKDRVQRRSRGVHQAGFYVLWSASMPSVLVELGYLTNPREARYLNSDRGQTYLASGIFRAVRAYKNEYNKGIVASE